MIERSAQERVGRYAELGRRQGRAVLRVGQRPGSGVVLCPRVVTDLPPDSPVLRDEIFGPVLAIERVRRRGGVDIVEACPWH